MTDSVTLNFTQFQKKNYEKDLLDQEKEREELLFLEWYVVSHRHRPF